MSREITSPKATVLTASSHDGAHTIEFNEGSHRYKLDGKAAVGVTTFLKAGYVTSMGLISWFKTQTAESIFQAMTVPDENGQFMPRDGFWPISQEVKAELFKTAKAADRAITQEAADIGTIVHGYAELYSLGKIDEAEKLLDQVRTAQAWPMIETCINKFKAWHSTNGGELVNAEALVASPKHLFCGKIDRLDRVNGKLRLRDYKTSKDIFLDQFIQLGAYAIAIEEWLGMAVEELEVVRFGKDDGEFETLIVSDPLEIKVFREQAIRCRKTHEFRKLENDPRWKWGA